MTNCYSYKAHRMHVCTYVHTYSDTIQYPLGYIHNQILCARIAEMAFGGGETEIETERERSINPNDIII